MILLEWLNSYLLKMDWLHSFVVILVEQGFGMDINSKLGGSVHFFIYDVIKIFILLSVLIFAITYIQTFFPPERTKKILGRYNGIAANLMAALLGTVTPFCSCSSIPIFIGFTNAGLPLSVSFSFLISSPLVDIASIILLASIFNWKIALAYVILGIILASASGTIIGKLNLNKYIEPYVFQNKISELASEHYSTKTRLLIAKEQVLSLIRYVWVYIFLGVGIGAGIHNWIPQEWIAGILGGDKWYSVLMATVIGAPIYADIFSTLPIAEALLYKGAGLGTVLAFMMAITALSLPSMIMLKRVVKSRLLLIFFGLVILGIIFIGHILNIFSYLLL